MRLDINDLNLYDEDNTSLKTQKQGKQKVKRIKRKKNKILQYGKKEEYNSEWL